MGRNRPSNFFNITSDNYNFSSDEEQTISGNVFDEDSFFDNKIDPDDVTFWEGLPNVLQKGKVALQNAYNQSLAALGVLPQKIAFSKPLITTTAAVVKKGEEKNLFDASDVLENLDNFIIENLQKTQERSATVGSTGKGFIGGDLEDKALATIDALVSTVTTVVPAILTRGLSLGPQVIAPFFADYNIEKAKSIYGEDDPEAVEKLVKNGQVDVNTPATLGLMAYKLEKIGFKHISKYITKAGFRPGQLYKLLKTGSVNGVQEYFQGLLEDVNIKVAKGMSEKEAIKTTMTDGMFTEEGAERFLMGFVGGVGTSTGGRVINRALKSDSPTSLKINDYINDLGDLQELKAKALRDKDEALLDRIEKKIKQTEEEFADYINENNKLNEFLTKEQEQQLKGLVEQKDSNSRELENLFKQRRRGKISDKEFNLLSKDLYGEQQGISDGINQVKVDANKIKIEKDLSTVRKAIKLIPGLELTSLNNEQFKEEINRRRRQKGKKEIEDTSKIDGLIVDNQILINMDVASQTGAITVGSHELLHAVVKGTLNDKDGNLTVEGRKLIDDFRKTLSGKQKRIIQQKIDNNYRFKRDSEGRKIRNKDGSFIENPYEQYAEEYLTAYIVGAREGQFNQSPLGAFFTNIFKQKGFDKAYFESGSDLKAFLNDFVSDVRKGEISEKFIKAAKQGLDIKTFKLSKTAADKVNETYKDKGVEAAGEISMQFRGMAENIFNRTVARAEGDIKQNLKNNKEDIIAGILYDPGTKTRKGRTVLGLVKDYPAYVKKQQEAGKPVAPLAGFINNMLPERAKEIFEPYGIDMAVTKSITDEKIAGEVAKKEAKEDIETKIDTKEKDPREIKNLDDVNLNDGGIVAEEILNKVYELAQKNPKDLEQKITSLVKNEFTKAIKAKMGKIGKAKGETVVSEEYKAFHALEFNNIVKALPISVIKKNYNNLFKITKLGREKDKKVDPVTGKVTYPGKGIYKVDPVKKSAFGKHFLIGGYTTLLARQKKLAEHIATAKTKEAVNDYIEENSNDMGAVIKAKLEIIKDGLDKQKNESRSFDDIKFSITSVQQEYQDLMKKFGFADKGRALEQAIINHIKRFKIKGLDVAVEVTTEKGGLADVTLTIKKGDGKPRVVGFEIKLSDKKVRLVSNIVSLYDIETGKVTFTEGNPFGDALNRTTMFNKAKKAINAFYKDVNNTIERYNNGETIVVGKKKYTRSKKPKLPLVKTSKDILPIFAHQLALAKGLAINVRKASILKNLNLGKLLENGYLFKKNPSEYIEFFGSLFAIGKDTTFGGKVNTVEGAAEGEIEMSRSSEVKTKKTKKYGVKMYKVQPRFMPKNLNVTSKSNFSLANKVDLQYLMGVESNVSNTVTEGADGYQRLSRSMVEGRRSDKPTRGITILDFDDTLATTKSMVKFTAPDGTKGELNAEQYARDYVSLLEEGYKFDFSDFNKVVKAKVAPLFKKALKLQSKFGPNSMFVLTARPPKSAAAIRDFLKGNGLNIPLKNITGLGNSTSEAKALWVADKVTEGYNDFYFADDALQNVQAVKNILEQFDVKSKVQQAKIKFSKSMNNKFNDILQEKGDIPSGAIIDAVTATKKGAKKGRFNFFIPASNEDLVGLIYSFLGKGKKGEQDFAFFKEALIDPLNKGYRELNRAKQSIANDFKNLKKQKPDVYKKMKNKVPGMDFTISDAVRVYLWDKAGFEIPGISKQNQKKLVSFIKKDSELQSFAETIGVISKSKEGYVPPSEHWITEDIRNDLVNATNKIGRKQFFNEFIENADILFSKDNLNKIESIYGTRFRSSLEDILYATKNGTNRTFGNNKIVNEFMNWINGSIGATMFFNARSAVLQTISFANFINWGDNNVFQAGRAFANQKQFWKDFSTIFNSAMLKQRRSGLQNDINAAELSTFISKSDQPVRAAINWLLNKGFLPTQFADSFAIALGGSSMYRNRINTYLKQGLSQKEAQEKAWLDFTTVAEDTQQSARPDKLSQQQRSVLGRLILAFQNTPTQYMRLTKKAASDLINNRGDAKTNISKIVYYTFVQNAIFYSLQSALFAMMFGDDDDEQDEFFKKKQQRVANGMMDTILRGLGIGGAVVSTLKNMAIEFAEQKKKKYNRDEGALIIEALNLSPPIGIKARKLDNFQKGVFWNEDVMKEMELLDLNNPIWSASTSLVEATTNIPLNRLYKKSVNISEALNAENEAWQRIALGLGWSTWDVGIKNEDVQKVKEQIKKERRDTKTYNKERTIYDPSDRPRNPYYKNKKL